MIKFISHIEWDSCCGTPSSDWETHETLKSAYKYIEEATKESEQNDHSYIFFKEVIIADVVFSEGEE